MAPLPAHCVCSVSMLRHDPLAYRPLLLLLTQSGAEVAPLGALRLLGAYAWWAGALLLHAAMLRRQLAAVCVPACAVRARATPSG